MHTKALTLAVATLLTVGVGGVATATTDTATADAGSAAGLPANHTVDVVTPDELTGEAGDRAVEIAWANDEVRRHFAADAAVHFEVTASKLHDGVVSVSIAPMETPGNARVVADVRLDQQTVTSVVEPVTLDASNAVSLDAGAHTTASEANASDDATSHAGNVTRVTAGESIHLRVNESTIEDGENGSFVVEVEDGDRSR
ncbi:hypothetical protein [Haloarcula litorea]|uniref:hypothetical protein n=1 Tax=Haloarcula litorea TaxID=3032579 RepID=UPI0023E8435B|nr:hypothetical protein [Halomicroarcula sp. GDY20]